MCNGISPKITDPEAPKWYIDLMKDVTVPNPDNRPNIKSFHNFYDLSKEG
jgi:hypothetical protein